MTCNNLQNFTKFSRTSVRLHSGRIVGFLYIDNLRKNIKFEFLYLKLV